MESFSSSSSAPQQPNLGLQFQQQQQKEHYAMLVAFSNVVTLNHQGIIALQESRFEDSIACLTSAVRMFSTQIDLDENHPSQQQTFRLWHLQVSQRVSLLPNEDVRRRQLMNLESTFADHNTLYLEQSLFQVDLAPSPEAYSPPEAYEQHVGTLSAVMLYNLALAHHLQGLTPTSSTSTTSTTTPKPCSHHLLRTLKLYTMAAEAGQRFWVRRNDDDNNNNNDMSSASTTLMLTALTKQVLLTIHNNKAHASFQLWDVSSCHDALHVVQHLLGTLTGGSPDYNNHAMAMSHDQQHPEEEEEERHGALYLNILFAQGHASRSAPAA